MKSLLCAIFECHLGWHVLTVTTQTGTEKDNERSLMKSFVFLLCCLCCHVIAVIVERGDTVSGIERVEETWEATMVGLTLLPTPPPMP